jgi:conjugative relaxase-like TrwC/TraI family protein
MLSLSHVTAAQAENYYEKDDYYTQDLLIESGPKPAQLNSSWYGNGAETLGLTGEIQPAAFKELLRGNDLSGNCLHGRPIDLDKHRAATDYTFSAPKSVSIAGLIQQDTRVIDAHDQAVATALSILESRYAQARISSPEGRRRIGTGNITAAVFRHETSREQDPQLHSHCVVINTTQLADGTWRSLSNEEVISNQKLLGEIYQNELAYQLRQLGYGIEAKANGQFELTGYGQPLLDTFSTRSQQIKDYIQQWGQRQAGGAPVNAKQKKEATLKTRKSKQVVPREVLRSAWSQAVQAESLSLPPVPISPRDLSEPSRESGVNGIVNSTVNAGERQAGFQTVPTESPPLVLAFATRDGSEQSRESAVNAVVNATVHAGEREAVFRRSKIERFALEHHLGQQRFSDLTRAIDQNTQLIPVDDNQTRYTTQAAIDRERDTLRLVNAGKQQVNAIVNAAEMAELINVNPTLTQGQRQAIELSLTTHDQVIAWQGVAGSGKTYSLKLVAEQSERNGYIVQGLAPSAEAAAVLGQEAGIPGNTVASWLNTQADLDSLLGKEIWIVDEAGLLSTKDAHALLLKATQQRARVILVGDTRQLSAVEAGNPFKSLQMGGISTAYLDESLRQKTQDLREAVALMAAGQAVESLEKLEQTGAIQEIPDQHERLAQITHDFLSLPQPDRHKTLILAGTNQERLMLTAHIRQALQTEGNLGPDALPLQSLRPKNLTTAQADYAQNYAVGDVLIPGKTYQRQGLEKSQAYRVMSINFDENQLVVQAGAGPILKIDPAHCQRKQVYEVQTLPIGIGDHLRWTKNDRNSGTRNGQIFTIDQLDKAGNAQVRDTAGNVAQLNLNGYQHIDYAWVSTTYGSQGKTAERVLAALDHTTSQESLYVTISRAKQQLTLYTHDQSELRRLAQVSRSKANASDYIPLFKVVPTHAQTPQNHQNRPSDDRRATGERIGKRLAASLSAGLPGAQHLDPGQLGVSAAVSQLSRSAKQLNRTLAAVSGPARDAADPAPPDLDRIAAELGIQIHAERLGQAVRAADAVLHQVEHTVDAQHQFAAANLHLLSQLESAARRRSRVLTPTEFKALAPRRRPTTRDYQSLWQHYSQGIRSQNPEHLTSLVGLKALADGQRPATVEQMFLTGSPRTQALLTTYSMGQIRPAVMAKVRYLTVVAAAQRDIRQASAPEIAYYQQCYQQNLPEFQFLGPLERDVRIAEAGFNSDHSNLRGVVKVLCQSPEMQRLAPDTAQEHLVSVLETLKQRYRERVQTQLSHPQKQQRQTSQGLEIE